MTNQIRLTITLDFGFIDGYQARESLQIQQILSKESNIRIKNLENGEELVYPVSEGLFKTPNDKVIDFVEKICFIQDVTGNLLTFPEDGSFDINDISSANELVSIIRDGKYKQTGMKFSAEFGKPAIELLVSNSVENKSLSFRITTEDSFVQILGHKVDTGPMTQYVKGFWDSTYEEVRRWIENSTYEEAFKLVLNDAEIIEEFEKWPRNQLKFDKE